tara:strand:- start:645 stop:917 length:273 start_codon:yes stop_codon:yes gene_type:complete
METTKEILSEEELVSYRSIHTAFKRAEAELAYATSQLSSIESRQKSSLMNYDQSLYALDDIQSTLTEKHEGDFKVNLDTGELIREDAINS